MQLVFKIFNLCGHDPPTSQTDGQTDRRHALQYRALHYSASIVDIPYLPSGGDPQWQTVARFYRPLCSEGSLWRLARIQGKAEFDMCAYAAIPPALMQHSRSDMR